jgi:hypothetical protein
MPEALLRTVSKGKMMRRKMSKKEFDVVYRALFADVKPPPKVKFKNPDRW